MTIRVLDEPTTDEIEQLTEILIGVVDVGASVGFLPPLSAADARAYWEAVIKPYVVLLVAEHEERVVGTAQLELATRANGNHRAEVNKVLVHPAFQRRGIGRELMDAVEHEARKRDRTLLHLDTREGDGSNALYLAMGYVVAGMIPSWARSTSGELESTVFYYKVLG